MKELGGSIGQSQNTKKKTNFAAVNVNIPIYVPPASNPIPKHNVGKGVTKSHQPLLLQMGPTLQKMTLLPTLIELAVLAVYLMGCGMWLPKIVTHLHNLYQWAAGSQLHFRNISNHITFLKISKCNYYNPCLA